MHSFNMLLLCFATVFLGGLHNTEARHVVHFFNASRDYLDVTSEGYPESYPSGNQYTWEWSVQSGYWGVYFLTFDLVCDDSARDTMTISYPLSDRKYYYDCRNKPTEIYFQQNFNMDLEALLHPMESENRGFKCHVLYGSTKDEVESKINSMKAMRRNISNKERDSSSALSVTEIALILIIFVLIVAVSVVACVIIRRRRQHQQTTTNTSVHVNIEGIRRESSVSYTRNGGARPRLESQDSLGTEQSTQTKTKRPVKRSESNASWAMRAEMATSGRTGSCSGESHRDNQTVVNIYSPFPSSEPSDGVYQNNPGEDTDYLSPDTFRENDAFSLYTNEADRLGNTDPRGLARNHPGKNVTGRKLSRKGSDTSLDGKEAERAGKGRLSSISEESRSSKLAGPLAVPVEVEETSVAIANAGYMVMTGCQDNYINYAGL